MSFLKIFINKPVGVTTKKNITPIINGETVFPKKIPNLNQILLSGVKIFEFIKPRIRKIIDITKDHNLISPLYMRGYKAINKKTIKKTIPKFRFELI